MLCPPSIADERCYRLAMQSVATGMAIIDLEGRWVDVNPALARLLGHEPQRLHGQPVSDSFHADDAHNAHAHLLALSGQQAAPTHLPQRYRNREGEAIQAHAEIAVMRDENGQACYLVMHLRPSQPPARGEQAAREALTESESSMKALVRQQEIFAQGISHDLRAPLRAIDNFSRLLDNHSAAGLDDTGRDYLQRIRAAAERMGELIDALQDLARIERTDLAPESVDISMLAEWVAAELQDAQPQREAQIEVAPGLSALGNERLLRMLLQQLLDNAWRFSAADEPVRVQVEGSTAQNRVEVSVHDRGIGFDMRYVDKIFDPFQRLHGPEAGGGIGLAIARRIVERHGGRIWAHSEPGAGSVFTFELPAADANGATGHALNTSVASGSGPRPTRK